MIYLFNNQEELIKIINTPSIIALNQTETLTDENLLDDRISAEVKALDEELIQEIEYMAVKKRNSDYQYSLYYIVSATTEGTITELYGVVSGFEELDKTIIEDKRPTNAIPRVAIDVALEGTNWTSGFVGDVPNNSARFYYLSSLEAIKKICQVWGLEAEFVIEMNGSRIGARYINFYTQLGKNEGKRVVYGHNALKIIQEDERAGIYTALIGRGKGEQISDGEENESGQAGYGRRILFDDIEWSVANGDPIDKPLGQKYVELPEATATYGIKTPQGNRPKVGVVEFQEEEDAENLIKLTYRYLIETSRPLASFKTTPAYLDADIGDVVRVVRYDRHMDYETRVFEVVTNRLTNTKVNVKLGDQLTQSAGRQRANLANQISGIISAETDDKLNQLLDYLPSATGKNTNFYGDEEPENPKVNDVWWKPNPEGESKPDWIMRWTGEVWERLDVTSEAIEQQFEEIEQQAQDLADEIEASEGRATEKVNQALQDAKDWAEAEDARIEQEIGLEVANAQATADSAVEQIDTAVTNAGFTSLDDTIQNMNYITMNAEQNAQQAITNASNAYGLAQTSISEAQTAQANSLTALGKADNALDGVSSLNIRVDDVEAELELKADNAFMNEDGTLTTLSNAITFNAHRFSSDMSRIESRVESLAGEINLVILKDAHVGKAILETDIYPNPTEDVNDRDTMRDLIEVSPNEQLAFSKKAVVTGSNWVRIYQYDESYNNIQYLPFSDDERLVTTLPNAKYIWISYPRGSQPQLIRGTDFLPYRPNIVDQMTSDEVVLFRNEYDEFADKTERRLTAVDSSGGRLETAELLITQTADGLALKADQTTVNELTDEIESLGTEFDIVAGQVSSRVWNTDIEMAVSEFDSRNLIIGTTHESKEFSTYLNGEVHRVSDVGFNDMANGGVYTASVIIEDLPVAPSGLRLMVSIRNDDGTPYRQIIGGAVLSQGETGKLTTSFNIPTISDPGNKYAEVHFRVTSGQLTTGTYNSFKFEKGSEAKKWTSAPEDTMVVVGHVETEWTQTFDTFGQTVSDIDGRVTSQKQTIDDISSTVYDEHSGRISDVEQTASGLQSTVADKASQSQVTQLADGLNLLVREQTENLIPKESNLTESWNGWARDSSITFNRIVNNRTELHVGTAEQRISYPLTLEQGKKYKITFEARTHVDGRELSVGRGTKNIQRISLHSLARTYEAIFESDSSSHFSIYFHNFGTYEIGNVQVVETTAVSSAQISVLSDSINLRVEKGDLLSQINIEAEQTLIQSNKLVLDANSVVFTGSAFIPSAQIESLDAGKITSGEIETARLKVTEIVSQGLSGNEESITQLLIGDDVFQSSITNLTQQNVADELTQEYETVEAEVVLYEHTNNKLAQNDGTFNWVDYTFDFPLEEGESYPFSFQYPVNFNAIPFVIRTVGSSGVEGSNIHEGLYIVSAEDEQREWARGIIIPNRKVDAGAIVRFKFTDSRTGSFQGIQNFTFKGNKEIQVPVVSENNGVIANRITQTQNAIDIGLFGEEGAISRIYAGEEGLYLKGENIVLDGNVSMEQAFIRNLVASDITANTIASASATFTNLISTNIDAQSITAQTLTALRARIMGAYTYVDISGTGIGINRYDGNRSIELNTGGMDIYRGGGVVAGRVGGANDASNVYSGIVHIGAERGNAVSLSSKVNGSNNNWVRSLWVDGTSGQVKIGEPIMAGETGYGIELKQTTITGSGTGIGIFSTTQPSVGISFVGGRVWYRTNSHAWRDLDEWATGN